MKTIQLLFIASIVSFASCKEEHKNTSLVGEPDVISVKVARMDTLAIPNAIQATGLVSTKNEVNYSFKIGGVISRVFVNEGQFFRKGQLLATLNATEIAAGLSQTELGVDKAQRDYDRALQLYKDSVFTLEQLQNTKTTLEVAKKSSEAIAFNERYSRIYATSDGFVSKKISNEGEVVAGGIPVLQTNSTENNNHYTLKVGVTDREWAEISAGQTAKVVLDGYPGQTFKAAVFRKQQAADREIGSFQVELQLQLKDLTPAVGMFGKAEIAGNHQANALVIPYGSLVEPDGNNGFVFTPIGSDKVKKIPVSILKFDNEKVYIKDGLNGVEKIVISNSAYLNERSCIKIIP